MKITIKEDGACGKVTIPRGEYWASKGEGSLIILVGGGKTYQLPAVKRRSVAKSKTTQVCFFNGGGTSWSLVIMTPNQGEWMALIECGKSTKDKKGP